MTALFLCWLFFQDVELIDDADIKVDYTETVTMVNLPIKIQAGSGKPVKGLRLEDLRVIENGVQVELNTVRRVQTPLTIHFLFDLSISNERNLTHARRAVQEYIQRMKPGDLAKVSKFSSNYQPLTEYTDRKELLINKLNRMQATGSTALYDAMAEALSEMKQISGSRLLVVLSDGFDLMSRTGENELRNLIRNDGLPIVFVSFSNTKKKAPLLAAQLNFLKRLARESGGDVVRGIGPHTRELANVIGKQRYRYLVRFAPPGPDNLDQWRSLDVRIAGCSDCRLEYKRAYTLKNN
ncbi:MAG: VWA domain-containing protein [Acidobacteriota bacterium]|nr:VWA domain-containing protein [Acidobacteriota bacterium]